ncbi:hypothetical protein [Mycobacteroides abscessus]|uniref:hypothetical protein n=1 Tax=Mycobacteroides abscessus TaxID=36809 RepID=UPI0019CFFC15|nr:hypothetical protein [Mycobacteroides abscessus]MBN7457550.1 hypothetical protein [Mycobacteroides abscessus subsp. abscessus]
MTTPRTVWAVDVTTSVISLARITESTPPSRPLIGAVHPVSVAAHSPYSTWHHAKSAAKAVVEKIVSGGSPTLVIMAKNVWQNMERDSSAERRFRLYNAVEDLLFAAQIPVAEFPYATVARVLLGHTPRGKDTAIMARLEAAAGELWDIVPPTKDVNGKAVRVPFRVPVSTLAAVGATAVGVPVPGVEVSDAKLQILGGKGSDLVRANPAIQWPRDLKLPADLAAWERLRADPSRLWVKHRDGENAA